LRRKRGLRKEEEEEEEEAVVCFLRLSRLIATCTPTALAPAEPRAGPHQSALFAGYARPTASQIQSFECACMR